jgi:fibronectin type 3 domain-containing protein
MRANPVRKCRVKLLLTGCATIITGCLIVTGCRSVAGFLPKTAEHQGEGPLAIPIAPTQLVAWGQPQNVSVATNGLRSAELSWQGPEGKVHRYRVERSESPDGPFAWVADAPGDRSTYLDGQRPGARLKDSTVYYYRVSTVFDKAGVMSEPSPPVKTVTAPPPVPPASVTAAATGSRAVTVTWAASASEGIKHYRVQRTPEAEPGAFEDVGTTGGTNHVDGGTAASVLKDSAKYRYRVIAVNQADAESAPSAAAAVETFPPPAPPRKLTGTLNEVRCVPLAWEPAPEEDVVQYDVYQARAAEGPFTKIGSTQGRTATQYTDGGGNPGNLEDEGTYYYRVRAVNGVTAESGDSETVRVTTRAVPPAMQEVVAVSGKPREIPVSWAVSPDRAVVGYEVWRADAEGDDWTQVARLGDRTATHCVDRGGQKDGSRLGFLKDGTEYQYKVIAFNSANVRSSASVPVKAKTKLIPVPPAGLEASTRMARLIRLTWQPNPEKDVNGYLIETSKKPDGSFRKLTSVQVSEGVTLAAEETELAPSVTKYYRVKALDREGLESEWSPVVQGVSKPLPDAPTGLTAQSEGNAFRIGWSPPAQSDVVQYKVWSKKLLGWDLVATTEQPVYNMGAADLAKAVTLAVTAVDKDRLESEKSEAVKVGPASQ